MTTSDKKIALMTNNLFKANFAFHNLAHHAEILSILPDFDRPVRLFDMEQIDYVIEQGERAAEAQLPYLQRLLASRIENRNVIPLSQSPR